MTAQEIADKIVHCFGLNHRVWIFGNGGSLADASHFAAEFKSLGPVFALNDPAVITAIGNDIGFDNIFERQILDSAKVGDLVIGISSSGKSENVINALATANHMGVMIIDWPREGKTTQEIQEYQYHLMHEVYLLVKKDLNDNS